MPDQAMDKYLQRGDLQEPIFQANALTILEKRYLRRDHQGQIMEDAKGMLMRVASSIAEIDEQVYHKSSAEAAQLARAFMTAWQRVSSCPIRRL